MASWHVSVVVLILAGLCVWINPTSLLDSSKDQDISIQDIDLKLNGTLVVWMAPFFSGGGYCSEATSFVQSISGNISTRIVQVKFEERERKAN